MFGHETVGSHVRTVQCSVSGKSSILGRDVARKPSGRVGVPRDKTRRNRKKNYSGPVFHVYGVQSEAHHALGMAEHDVMARIEQPGYPAGDYGKNLTLAAAEWTFKAGSR